MDGFKVLRNLGFVCSITLRYDISWAYCNEARKTNMNILLSLSLW